MKKITLTTILGLLISSTNSPAQTNGVILDPTNTLSKDPSAVLDVSAISSTGPTVYGGFLPPRVALTASNVAGPIASPATGLTVYNTATAGTAPNNVIPGLYYNAGTPVAPNWVRLSAGGALGFIENQTTTNQAAGFRINGNGIFNGGNVGIGTTTLSRKLTLSGDALVTGVLQEVQAAGSGMKVFRNLAAFSVSTTNQIGAFVIQTNVPMASNTMTKTKIEGYVYDATSPFSIEVGGYFASGGGFNNRGYINTGARRVMVRFAKNTATGNVVIILGDVGDSFNHPRLHVSYFMAAHSTLNDNFGDNWSIIQTTDLSAYDTFVTVPDVTTLPTGSGNYIQNQTSANQAAGFRINGNGIFNGGNVGIGLISPATILNVGSTTDAVTDYQIIRAQSRGFAGLELLGDNAGSSGEPGGAYVKVAQDANAVAGIFGVVNTANQDGAGGTLTGSIGNSVILNNTWNDDGGHLHFGTRNIVRMTVRGNGNVGIGTTNPTYKLHLIGKIKTDGIDETSDLRLKKNIEPIHSALATIAQMRGVTYNWKTDEFPERDFEQKKQYGLIAQELEKLIPELVNTDNEGWKSIEYSHLVPLLIEAVKELKIQVDEQKEVNKALSTLVETIQKNNASDKTNTTVSNQ